MARAEPRALGVVDAQTALGFLAQASGVLAGSLHYERTLTEVARLAVPDLADWCAVDIVQPDGSLRQITSVHPNPDHERLLMELRRRYREEKGSSEGVTRVVQTGEAELATDVTSGARLELLESEAEQYEDLAPRSYMIVPLVARARTIGALTMLSTTAGRHYNEADLDFAQHLARRFALAVDNSRLYDEAERSRSLLDTLFASVPVGLAFFDTDLCCVRVNDALAGMGGRAVEHYVGRHVSELFGERSGELAALYGEVLRSGRPVIDHDLSGWTPADPDETRHWLVSCTPVRPPDGPAIGVAVTVIDVTERRKLLLHERARRKRAAFLVRAGEILESSLDYETTLRNIARIAVPDVADWCAVHMPDDLGEIRLMALAHADPERERLGWELDERYPTDPDATRGVAAAIRDGRSEVTPRIDALLSEVELDDDHVEILERLGLRHSIVAPLRARGRTLGAITFVMAESNRELTTDDVELAEEIARRSGLAVDNARLYTERTRIAHTLQAELLPSRLPEIPGASVAVRYRAAGELNEVGGDFYDVFQRRDGDWAFVIGDVSGKGAEAAAVTALARHTLRTAARQPYSPRELLEVLNEALLVQRAGSEFCTVCVGRLRHDTDGIVAVSVSLGGHPPALVLRAADGKVEHHGTAGTLLGVFEDPSLHDVELQLAPGDLVLLYTDGVTEAGSPGVAIGEDGLAEILAGLRGRSPEEVVDAVEQAAVDAQDGRPRDDIALVALRVDPAA